MKIIIAGAGEVGVHLAKLLANESLDIILIDLDKKRLKYAESHTDVLIYRGDATSVHILEEAGIKKYRFIDCRYGLRNYQHYHFYFR